MGAFIDGMHPMQEPDVVFKFIQRDSHEDLTSWVQAKWRKPEFLSGQDQVIDSHKQEVMDWMIDTFGDQKFTISEHWNFWNVLIIDDPKSSKLMLFKLRWGDSHTW